MRPRPEMPTLPGVSVVVFDNLTMQVDYKAYSSEGVVGQRLDMTNWFKTEIPLHLANFDAAAVFCNGMFRKDLSLYTFTRSFLLDDREVVSNKNTRWCRFLFAADNGRLLDRPPYQRLWTPFKEYQPAMFGRLQSSYADVEYELQV